MSCRWIAFAALLAVVASTSAPPASAQRLSPWGGYEEAPFRSDSQRWRERRPSTRQRYADEFDEEADYRRWRRQQSRGWFDEGSGWQDERPRRRAAAAVRSGGAKPAITPKAPPLVSFFSGYEPGSIVIVQEARQLYYVVSSTQAYRYDISVGREGFGWQGSETVSRIADWPDWHPPAEMRQREPHLPKKMTGGVRNPLGATAIYLGSTLYRIHGTNDPKSIGRASSSGCFRMMNENVRHLAGLVQVGAKVHVLKRLPVDVATVGGAG